MHRRAEFQTQRVQPDEPAGVALVVCGCVGFHRRDLWIVETLRALAAGNDDVALVKLEAHDAGYIALRFGGERLQRFALRREPEAVVNQFAVF